MKKVIMMLCVGAMMMVSAEQIMLECEQFAELGGWARDSQFMDQMGSPFLLAHGMGEKVADAKSNFACNEGGKFVVWARTRNWTAPWSKDAAGKFKLVVNGVELATVLGVGDGQWHWERAGETTLAKGQNTIALHDLTGFDGRCDAVAFTRGEEPVRVAREVSGEVRKFDFVVCGGGIAGMCAAISAARLGLQVALINDRPVLGGLNSSEVRVHLGGFQNLGPYPRLGDVVWEIGPVVDKGNAQDAKWYEDERKMRVVGAEQNITLFLNTRVNGVEMNSTPLAIKSVVGENVLTGVKTRFEAPIFADCTGDGCVGFMAGADWRQGRESKAETGEEMAPEKGDKMTMGASIMWYTAATDKQSDFPVEPWMIPFDDTNCEFAMRGDWDWETGMTRDQVNDAEQIRDYGMLVIYSNWAHLKNRSARKQEFANRAFSWVAYVMGKRESRRLLGDHILCQQDVMDDVKYEDGTCVTTWAIDLHYPMPRAKKNYDGEPYRSICTHTLHYDYPIPYRCFYSRNVNNLFMAGRNISVTHVALGTVRVMRTTGMMGEVVGMAASVCKAHKCLPRAVYANYLNELKDLMTKGVGKPRDGVTPAPDKLYGCGALKRRGTKPVFVSGIYPHLAMFNDEGECGTGAVVPWAGSLWAITYGPHCPLKSSDKLYQITPELQQIVRKESAGGTHASRMIHKDSNQLFIGRYAIDADENVRVIDPTNMPGRLTGFARHNTATNKLYAATMEDALYELDVNSLSVKTHIREGGHNDKYFADNGVKEDASVPKSSLPGYHAKGLASGFGKVFISNNGEDSPAALTTPTVSSGALGVWSKPGENWQLVRRNQFTELTTRDGIMGNEHPQSNPVWAMGWDAASVLLGVTTNGNEWSYYRLPKGSFSYDGAHGWNTEWPRIREVGEGDDLLATMHGTFWHFPANFAPNVAAGIRARSNYLKICADFCKWNDWLVFGCDDTARNEFLNKRAVKGRLQGPGRSQSNLWFVKPSQLDTLGPALGVGAVWLHADLAEGATSDPYLFAGYAKQQLVLAKTAGASVSVELQIDERGDGNWKTAREISFMSNGMRIDLGGLPRAEWIRIVCTSGAKDFSAVFSYAAEDNRAAEPAEMFTGIKSMADAAAHPAKSNEPTVLHLPKICPTILRCAVDGDCYELDRELTLRMSAASAYDAARTREDAPLSMAGISQDTASIVYTDDNGRRWRLPSIANFDPKSAGRICREVVTERDLFNVGGLFYELPAQNAGGFRHVRPICAHGLGIADYASWRGMLVLALANKPDWKGTTHDSRVHLRRTHDNHCNLWVGAVDDLWAMGKARGSGAVWRNANVVAHGVSDPFLMHGFDRKIVTMKSSVANEMILQIDPTGDGLWVDAATYQLKANEEKRVELPRDFQAAWCRFTVSKPATVTAALEYK